MAEGVNDYVQNITRLQTIVGPAQRLQLPREHHQELRRAPPPAARGQVLRSSSSSTTRAASRRSPTRRRHDEPERARALPRRSRRRRPGVPLLAAVRQAHGPVHGPLRDQGVDRRHRARHPPPPGPLRDRQRPLRLQRGGRSPATASTCRTSSSSTSGSSAASTTSSTRRQRDYFLGLQLRFTDEDLKTILPFSAPVAGAAARMIKFEGSRRLPRAPQAGRLRSGALPMREGCGAGRSPCGKVAERGAPHGGGRGGQSRA